MSDIVRCSCGCMCLLVANNCYNDSRVLFSSGCPVICWIFKGIVCTDKLVDKSHNLRSDEPYYAKGISGHTSL